MTTTQDTLDHDSHDETVEPSTATITTTRSTISRDPLVAPVDVDVPASERSSHRHWVGWALVGAALIGVAALTISLFAGDNSSVPTPVGDAKDHAGFGQVTPVVAEQVGDAKDHAGYGQVTPVVAEQVGDAKDHAGYGQVTPVVAEQVGDAKDHAGYGSSTAD